MSDGERPTLAVTMTTLNSMRTLEPVLRSVVPVADRIVVIDSGSTDGTIECARDHGAEVHHQDWLKWTRQCGVGLARCADARWTLLLDSDESLTPELAASIRRTVEADDPAYDGWSFNRKLWFLGDWLHHAFQPEWRMRLGRSDRARMTGPDVHGQMTVPGRVGRLEGDCRHDSFEDFAALARSNLRWAVEQVDDPGARGGSPRRLLVSPAALFLKTYFLRGGWRDGRRGLVACAMAAEASLLKHAAIAASRLEPGDGERPS